MVKVPMKMQHRVYRGNVQVEVRETDIAHAAEDMNWIDRKYPEGDVSVQTWNLTDEHGTGDMEDVYLWRFVILFEREKKQDGTPIHGVWSFLPDERPEKVYPCDVTGHPWGEEGIWCQACDRYIKDGVCIPWEEA